MSLRILSCHPGRRSRSGVRGRTRNRTFRVPALRFAAAGMTALVLAFPAAAADLELRGVMQAAGPRITLADIFEGAGAKGAVVVGSAAPAGGQTVLDAGLVQAAARRAGLDWSNAEGRRRLIVASVDRAAARGTAAAHGHHAVLAYARNLNAGEIVQASDLVWSDEAVAPGDALADADAAVGMAARRPLRVGAAAASHDLSAPRVIKRDDSVQVAFDEGGITLTLTGRALGDAAVGDAVAVMNPASKKTVDAVASGPGRAVVGAAAEALRARAFPNPAFAYASLSRP